MCGQRTLSCACSARWRPEGDGGGEPIRNRRGLSRNEIIGRPGAGQDDAMLLGSLEFTEGVTEISRASRRTRK